MLSRLPVLDPVARGVVNALLSIALASLGAFFFFGAIPPASPELLRTVALIGASLLLAYVVEAVTLLPRAELDDESEEWLGFTVGTGVAGFLGVVSALLLSEHRSAGHANFLDDFGIAWSAISLLMLGGLLVLQPLLVARYRDVA